MGLVIIICVLAFVPQIFTEIPPWGRILTAVLITIFAFFFVTVSARIVGLVGQTSNPVSGMTIATLLGTALIFYFLGYEGDSGKMTVLTVGTVVAIAASISGDTAQDLKTGYLMGATPWKQQVGEVVGVLTSAVFIILTLQLLEESIGFGKEELSAPQATLMKLVVDGVLEQKLPWNLIAIGGGIALLVEICRLPVLPFAVGVYLPITTMIPVFLGGVLRWILSKVNKPGTTEDSRKDNGILFGSGLVGGEGVMGVFIAGVVFIRNYPPVEGRESLPVYFQLAKNWASSGVMTLISVGVFLALIGIFVHSALRKSQKQEDELPANQ